MGKETFILQETLWKYPIYINAGMAHGGLKFFCGVGSDASM